MLLATYAYFIKNFLRISAFDGNPEKEYCFCVEICKNNLNQFTMNTKFCTNTILFFFIIFYSSLIFAQSRGIILENNETKKTIFIEENKRVKIKTIDDVTLVGNFKVVDAATFSVDGISVPITSIVKIKLRSLELAVLRTAAITLGVLFLTAGVAGVIAGGYAVLITVSAVPPGLPLLLIPLSSDGHRSKHWNYKIIEN